MMDSDYGQVYRTARPAAGGFDYRSGWAGTIWRYGKTGRGVAVWEDLPQPTPDLAFERMLIAADKNDVTDVREWSGDLDSVTKS